ncbi:polysaccharide biosynthesis protein [Haloferax sulfurifontis]|nr:polysaccharide biosynthesis protein [Haloferax sulfurifontis]
MVAIPADFGLRGAVEKRISEGESQGRYLSSAILLKIPPVMIIVAGIFVFRPWINNYLGAEVAALLAIALILQEASQLTIVVLKGELRVGETAVLEVVRQATWLGVGGMLVSQGLGARALIYGLLAGLFLVFSWGCFKISVIPQYPSRGHASSLFNYGKYNAISSVGGYFYSWMDVAIIGLFLTQAHVGAYEVAWRITTVVILLSRSIATAVFPQFSEWSGEGAKNRIKDVIPQVLTPSLILVIPSFFGTVLFSKEILGLVFGVEYEIAWLALIILMFDQVTEAAQVVFGRSLQALDRPDLAARATAFGVILNLILNIILVSSFGITGAAIATMVASLFSGLILHFLYLSKIISIKIPYAELLWCVLAALCMTFLLVPIRWLVTVNSIIELLVVIALGTVLYMATILLSPSLRSSIFKHYNNVVGEN